MNYSILTAFILSVLSVTAFQCGKNGSSSPSPATTCYQGKLEIAGICRNYTISMKGRNIDTSKVEASWTDPTTNKTYQNVFKLGTLCSFPDDIKEGDEFYFTIADNADKDCATCMAYYPAPQKQLFIKVQSSGCSTQ